MREIAYRGICKATGDMVCGTSIICRKDWTLANEWVERAYILDGDACNIFPPVSAFLEVRKETVGQFTGLKDKNGREIYEGDIISSEHEDDGVWAVRWWNEKSCYVLCNGGDWTPQHSSKEEFLLRASDEVIGNIHTHPELLEDQ